MIPIETFRIEKNFLISTIKSIVGYNASLEVNEALQMLVTYFLEPQIYDGLCIIYIETIEKNINKLDKKLSRDEMKIFNSNIENILSFLKLMKEEIPLD